MKKTLFSLAAASSVIALALSLASPIYAQTDSTGSSYTGSSTDTSGTTNGSMSTSTTNSSTSSTTPGLPNTGAGGDAAANAALLLTSGLVAIGGTVLVARKLAV